MKRIILDAEPTIALSEVDHKRIICFCEGEVGIVQTTVEEGIRQFRVAWGNEVVGNWHKNLKELITSTKELIKFYQV